MTGHRHKDTTVKIDLPFEEAVKKLAGAPKRDTKSAARPRSAKRGRTAQGPSSS